jgi:serine protease Do
MDVGGMLKHYRTAQGALSAPARLVAARRVMALALMLALAGTVLPGGVQSARADTADINAAARSVVRVVIVMRDSSGYDVIGHGTGFAVTPKLIVTNAHVLAPLLEDDRLRLGIVPAQGRTGYFARIVRVAGDVDLALVELTEDASLPVSTLYSGRVEDGQDVYAVGYPANVDQALGLGLNGLVSPQPPVKTRGQVSAGRSSADYDTILHTAAIGVGNSGGPLLDPCGRVVGVNAFGTISDNGSDSEFYFAVSMRELAPFLRAAGVTARTSASECRSLADLDAEETARSLREEAEQRARLAAASAERNLAAEKSARRAELDAIDERDTLMGLAGLMVVFAMMGGLGGVYLLDNRRREQAMAAGAFTVFSLLAALAAWIARPSVSDVIERGDEAQRAILSAPAKTQTPSASVDKGRFICRFLPDRSRVTVSNSNDVELQWDEGGCVNGRTQYGISSDGWTRIMVPDSEQTVSVSRYDPATRSLRTDRYFLDLNTMGAAREARGSYQAPACGAGPDAARDLGDQQEAIRQLLPDTPNDRLVYRCEPGEIAPAKDETAGAEIPGGGENG